MWLNSRSRSNGHTQTRFAGSLTGCDGTRSILMTILPLPTHSGGCDEKEVAAMMLRRSSLGEAWEEARVRSWLSAWFSHGA